MPEVGQDLPSRPEGRTLGDDHRLVRARRADAAGRGAFPGQGIGRPAGRNAPKGRTLPDGELLILCDEGLVVKMTFPASLKASVDVMELTDRRFSGVWGPSLRRINLASPPDAPAKGSYEFRISELGKSDGDATPDPPPDRRRDGPAGLRLRRHRGRTAAPGRHAGVPRPDPARIRRAKSLLERLCDEVHLRPRPSGSNRWKTP